MSTPTVTCIPSIADSFPFDNGHIFSFLGSKEILLVRSVCRKWRDVVAVYNLLPTSQQFSEDDIRETVLWTLHNRACEAAKPDGMLRDPKLLEIYRAIPFDYVEHFGAPHNAQALRSVVFDREILRFWRDHPDGTVVNLGEGLETQRFRLERHKSRDSTWITVDLPNAIFAREQFIQPDDRHLHISASAMDVQEWAIKVPVGKPVFLTAQGLLMYLPKQDVQLLFRAIAKWFPGSTLIFDCISQYFSERTMKGFPVTKSYRMPKMPFGVDRFLAPPLFQSWVGENLIVEEVSFPLHKLTGCLGYIAPILFSLPIIRGYRPQTIFRIRFPTKTTKT